MSDYDPKKFRRARHALKQLQKEAVEEVDKRRSEMPEIHRPTERNIPSSKVDKDVANDDLTDERDVADDDSTSWDDLDEFCSVDDLTAIIPVDRKTLYNMINDNEIPGAQRFGRKILLHTETVRDWLTGGDR